MSVARGLAWSAGLLACLLGGAFGYLRELEQSGRPLRGGERRVAGLAGEVTVRFDARGVPHVSASSTEDLARALGYLHANDRMFQMELGRRLASGRLSELLGPSLLEIDVEQRTLDLRGVAERSVAASSERARAWYAAYAEGVNAWLAERGSDLPPELRLLQVRPEAWSPADSAGFALLMAQKLVDPGEFEQVNLDWLARVGPSGLADLLGADDLYLPPGIEELSSALGSDGRGGPRGESAAGFSNNWAVGGDLSASGGALLANDPHLGLALPAQFFVVRLSCPGFEALGATLPGHPAVVIGRSERRAWALTNTGLDVDDVTVETLSPDGRKVERPEGWRALEWRTERFGVRFGTGVERQLARSDRGAFLPGDPTARGLRRFPRSLAWVGLEPGDSLELFLALATAERPSDVRSAAAGYVAPAQNLLCAEADGSTWFTVIGRAPLRRRGDGRLPVLGASPGHGWRGLRPQSDNPFRARGPEAFQWTANEDIRPAGYDRPFQAQWAPPDRARRIAERLGARESWTSEGLSELQLDLYSGYAERLLALLFEQDAADDPRAQDVLDRLLAWDRRMTGSGGALFACTLVSLKEAVFDEGLGADRVHGFDARKVDECLVRLLAGEAGYAWFDRPEEPGRQTRADVLPGALASALDVGEAAFGNRRVDGWSLAEMQHLVLQHPLADLPLVGPRWSRGPIPLDGHGSTVAAIWNRWRGAGLEVIGGAALRYVADLGSPELTTFVQPGGQSGHPSDPHYADQLEAWRTGKTFPTPWQAPPSAPERTLRLRPAL